MDLQMEIINKVPIVLNSKQEFQKDFDEYLTIFNKVNPSTYATVNTSTYPFKINFFEWSDITRKPLLFSSLNEFEAFLTKSNIPLSTEDRLAIVKDANSYCGVYATCKKGTTELIVASSEYTLKRVVEEQTSKTTVTTVTNYPQPCQQRPYPMNQQYPVNPVYAHCCYDGAEDYDCWD